MKYVFGPVLSRRLGRSLGIDTVPFKTCNWNCVYCQLGRTRRVTNERREFAPEGEILAEFEKALELYGARDIDWVTFVGSGEPLLHSGVGRLLEGVRARSNLPVAVITNGSLLYLPEVREELLPADAVMPTLEAGSPDLFRRINRPHSETTFERLVEGIATFRRDFSGYLWVETMLVRDLNDTTHALQDLAEVLSEVRPHAVHINVPSRPPAEAWVRCPDEQTLALASIVLGDAAVLVAHGQGVIDLESCQSLADSVLAILRRHPMAKEELERNLAHWTADQVDRAIQELSAAGRLRSVQRSEGVVWSVAEADYR